jgi:cytoskeletal protein CcmA (bactofilin family)
MGLFKREPPPPPPASHVGPKTVLRGTLTSSHDVTVEGAVEGSAVTKACLSIAPSGRVEGRAEAERMECAGALRGEASVSKLALFASTASFDGELKAAFLVVLKGAKLIGRISRKAATP